MWNLVEAGALFGASKQRIKRVDVTLIANK